jgi:NDP-sugar pyrophosphorylase family protein
LRATKEKETKNTEIVSRNGRIVSINGVGVRRDIAELRGCSSSEALAYLETNGQIRKFSRRTNTDGSPGMLFEVTIGSSARIGENVHASPNVVCAGNATIFDNAVLDGSIIITGDVGISGNARVRGDPLILSGNIFIGPNIELHGVNGVIEANIRIRATEDASELVGSIWMEKMMTIGKGVIVFGSSGIIKGDISIRCNQNGNSHH